MTSRTVFMHVGIAKTGTTYLQRILYSHRDQLKAAGLLYPGRRSGDHYVASVDLRKLETANSQHLKSDGMWDRIADEVNRFDGNSVISHETFARCSTAEIKRVVRSCGDVDVKVVLTVRDLGRQIPAVWQETLKNRSWSGYDEFLDDVFVNLDSGENKFFWRAQDVRKVVRRWGRQVGMDNVTVVTVPPSGAPRDELWKRFAAAIELPDVAIALPSAASNTSLGPAEAELLRHVNMALSPKLPWPRYLRLIRRQFAEQRLARRPSERISIPEQWNETVRAQGQSTIRYLRGSGCRVIGDLSDLRPRLSRQTTATTPDELSRDEILAVSGQVIRDLVLSPGGRRRRGRGAPSQSPEPIRALEALVRRVRARLPRRVRRRLTRG